MVELAHTPNLRLLPLIVALTVASAAITLAAFFTTRWIAPQDEAAATAALLAVAGTYAAALLSLFPLAIVRQPTAHTVVTAYLAGMVLRMMLCLGAALLAVAVLHWPMESTLLTMAVTYLALLGVEVFFVVRYVNGLDRPSRTGPNPPETTL